MAQIWVGTYKKYNEGNLFGKWFDLEGHTKDSLYKEMAEFHKDEADPEFMFQDFEGVPRSFYSECSVPDELFEYLASPIDDDVKAAYMSCFDKWDEDDCNEKYRGRFDTWEDMAEELLSETGDLEAIPENLRYYFDYKAYARDLKCGGDFVEDDHHFFLGN